MPESESKKLPILKIAIGLGVVAILVVAAVIVVLTLYRPMTKEFALQAARERGVELDCDVIEASLDEATLEGCRFKLIGVRGLRGTFRKATVELDGTSPKSVTAEEVDVRVHGSAADVTLELSEWTQTNPKAFRAPVTAKAISVQWSPTEGGKPWLNIDDGTLAPLPNGGVFVADDAVVADVSIGKVGASWLAKGDAKTGSVALGFGKKELDKAPIVVDVNHGATPPTATVTVRPTGASALALPLGIALPIDDVVLSGRADLVFHGKRGTGPVKGKVAITAKGYVPPHPVELQGIVFGDKTTFDAAVEIDAARTVATLTDSNVQAGAFKLKGGGEARRHEAHTTLDLDYKGSIPCTAVAKSAAVARLGKVVGGILGGAAKQAVQGSIGVRVKITADSRRLEDAKLERTVGVGCGIKPLKVKLPPIPSGLPPLPSAFPVPTNLPLPFPPPAKGGSKQARPVPSG